MRRIDEKKGMVYLATNKHVVEGFQNASFEFCVSDDNGLPLDDHHIKITITNLQDRCIKHPLEQVDLCFVDIMNEIEEVNRSDRKLFFKCIGEDLFISKFFESQMTAIEDIIMIGYPEGLIDLKNNKPVVRKGLTATSYNVDYNGAKEFLVDVACYYGSSGSPVFIETTGLKQNLNDKGLTIGVNTTYCLAGVLYAMPVKKQDGSIKIIDVPTTKVLCAEMEMPLNLGYIIKTERIKELFDIVEHERSNY